jgi:polygalacturonase
MHRSLVRNRVRRLAVWACGVVVIVPRAVVAQDRRTVTEPTIPPSCTVLRAALVPVGDTTLTEADERRPDTQRIQRALDGCAKGKAVVLEADGDKRAFLAGPLELRTGVTLVVGDKAVLFGSRNARDYDLEPGRCGTVDERGHGCRALITAERATGAGVMGPGTIDGRGWAKLLGQQASWWDLAQEAKVKNQSQSCPRLMQLTRADNFTLYRLTLKNSPNFHVVFDRGDGFTAWGVVINTPKTARNTDGIDPASSTNVTITRSFIHTGDDDVAIKAGTSGPASHMTIAHNHFAGGHGMSIGSETNGGARAIRVLDLSIDGNDNGLRIKSNASRGGLVEDVEYRDVCIRGTKNPIEMDTHYSASPRTTGDLIPVFRNIRLKDIRVLDGGNVILDGYDTARRLEMAWDNVTFGDPGSVKVRAAHAVVTQGPGLTNLPVSGEDVRLTGTANETQPNACAGKFVDMPMSAAAGTQSAYAAIVDAGFTGTDGSPVAGVPTFRTLGSALTNLPANGGARTVVFIRNGRYHEKLTVDRPRVTLLGESRPGTILTYDAAADTPSPGGGTYGTRGSFTLRIVAPDFRAENLTIENAFDYPGNLAKPDSDRTKLRNQQAVALMTDLGSDRATFVNVRITGYQDTLFPNAGRTYFYKCEVVGHVDFIFGAGQAVFDDCDIVSRDRGSKTNNGYVTAPSTQIAQPYGFLFIHTRLKKERAEMAAGSVTLGRPWHAFGDPNAIGSSVFIECWMDDHIGVKGWDRMSAMDSTGNRVWYEPESARFFEFGTTGPGAVAGPTRRVLSAEEAKKFTPPNVLGGWVPPLAGLR